MKSLAFQVVEGNMGAQYHHYLLGIILQNEEGKKFVFNNYMRSTDIDAMILGCT